MLQGVDEKTYKPDRAHRQLSICQLGALGRFDPAMFGTLRYFPEKKTGEFVERGTGVVGHSATNKPQHSACDNCRVKKVCGLEG